jgi:hypothetical protein
MCDEERRIMKNHVAHRDHYVRDGAVIVLRPVLTPEKVIVLL